MKTVSFSLSTLLLVALQPFVSSALQAQTPSDTIPIRSFIETPLITLPEPLRIDSLDLKGKAFDRTTLFRPLSFAGDLPQGRVINTGDGWIEAQRSDTIPHGALVMRYHTAGLLSEGFEKGTLCVESVLPFRLYLDGKEILRRDGTLGQGASGFTLTKEVSLLPSLHTLTLCRMQTPNDSLPDRVRIRWVSSRPTSDVLFTTTPTHYVNLEYVMGGPSMQGVSISPSGKYVLLRMQRKAGDQLLPYVLLYADGRLVQTLSGEMTQVKWLSQEDILWFRRKGAGEYSLIYYDPRIGQERVGIGAIPEGSFDLAADDRTLVYTVQQKGKAIDKDIQLLRGRDDRMPGYRDRYFIYLYKDQVFRPLTFGHHTSTAMDVSEDGLRMLISTSRAIPQFPFYAQDLEEVDLRTLSRTPLFTGECEISQVLYTSHSDYLVVKGTASAFGGVGKNLPQGMVPNNFDNQLFLYNIRTKEVSPLTRNFPPSVTRLVPSRTHFVAYFTAEDEDRISLYRLNLSSGQIDKLNRGEEVVRSFSVDRADSKLVYCGQSANNADRFYEVSLRSLREKLLYDLSAEKLKHIRLGKVEDWDFTMPDGGRVQGRYYLPPSFDPSRSYPMIVYYYGGTSPTTRYFEWTYSAPMYAAQGYVVYVLNPSGTTGFGQEYAARHVNAWGKRTADEIIAAVNGFCRAHPYVNPSKIGCIGASYGGFMTQYLQTQTTLFAAAVSHAGISSIASYWGEGFWGVGYSTVASRGSYPWNNPELYVNQSPLFHADKIQTPLLLLHGTADTNVPDGESVQMYNALKVLGKEVAYIRVFGQDHHIIDPVKRQKWTYATFAWFQRWLKDDPSWWNEMFPEQHL